MKPIENIPILEPLQFKFVSSFILLTIIAGLGMGVARVLTSLYAVHIQATDVQLGLIAAAQNIGLLFMALPVGVLIQRFGTLRIFFFGSVIGSFLYSLHPLHVNAWYLLLMTALVSFIVPMRFISIQTVFLTHLKRLGPAKAGWFRGANLMGFFLIAPIFTLFLIGQFGYKHAYFAVAVLFLMTLIFASTCFVLPTTVVKTKVKKISLSSILEPIKLIRIHPHLRTVCSLEFMSNFANNYFGFFIVVIAIQNFGLQSSNAVMLLTGQGVIFVGSLLSLGGLAEILGYHKFYLIGLSSVSVALIGLSIAQHVFWLWPSIVLFGLGLGILQISNFMSFAKIGEQTQMIVISPLLAMVGPAGGILGGLVGAVFGQQFGLQNLFAPIGLIFLIMTFFLLKNNRFQDFLKENSSTQLQRQEP
ncbi:MFS transporter [Acinetobacter gerneri]|uniref:Major facilitator superfamily (MFS) profile domain-containing protein n=1 Tax=Acinetobacter gerneri DSM 14967 = CIP 107464 = MTCC 9824 TaxID=1120926 RepID=N8Y724_9GAMM|nr:MFS transporter [Acinetobacter gerneri]ENV32552.1 hypothetical protein F960_03246 [Acinetobacter gerneri DSM 14967 = CIP 107464 = MTCC 9824]EPR80461.1 Permeases of the major facilitator superfamily [Acinetobacter gerneri DSM 14967 = CIP 107464 = MTCC 9824]